MGESEPGWRDERGGWHGGGSGAVGKDGVGGVAVVVGSKERGKRKRMNPTAKIAHR
jgi:hypothetical protein